MCDEGGCGYVSATAAAELFPHDVFLTGLSAAASVGPFSRVRARTVAGVVACAVPPQLFEDTIDVAFATLPKLAAACACFASFEPVPTLGISTFPFCSTDG